MGSEVAEKPSDTNFINLFKQAALNEPEVVATNEDPTDPAPGPVTPPRPQTPAAEQPPARRPVAPPQGIKGIDISTTNNVRKNLFAASLG